MKLGKVWHEKLWPLLKRWLPVFTILTSTVLFIVKPAGGPHISIPGNEIIFDIISFQHAEITFANPVKIQKYAIEVKTLTVDEPIGTPSQITNITIEQEIKTLTVTNPIATTANFKTGNNTVYAVHVNAQEGAVFDIAAISIDGDAKDLKRFCEQSIKVRCDYIRFNYMRQWLSQIIFKCNDFVSNIILTVLVFYLVWFGIGLTKMEMIAYLTSDKMFGERLQKCLHIEKMSDQKQKQDGLDKYVALYDQSDARYRFLQTLGPAVGFILTVTSLVQALHAPTTTVNGIEGFMSGIHIAMISTFVGLLLRLFAMEAARVNEVLLVRTSNLIGA